LPSFYLIKRSRESDKVRSIGRGGDIEVAGIERDAQKGSGSRPSDDELDLVTREDFKQGPYVRWFPAERHCDRA
jgi:hypothetical protein